MIKVTDAHDSDVGEWAAIAAVAAAVAVYGVAFGVLARAAGLSAWHVAAMGVLVLAGGSQFAFVGVLAAGGAPLAGAVSGLLLNSRLLGMGVSVAPLFRGPLPRRLLASHLVVDEVVALALAAPDPDTARRRYWRSAAVLVATWQVTTLGGVLLGAGITDPARFGLDVAFPAAFVVLLLPLLQRPGAVASAAAGGLIAVVLTPLLPVGLPVAVAGIGGLAGMAAARRGTGDVAEAGEVAA